MNDEEKMNLLEMLRDYFEELEPGNYSLRINVEHCDEHTHLRVFTELGTIGILIEKETGEVHIGPLEEAVSVFAPSAVTH